MNVFGVKCLFNHVLLNDGSNSVYEERVIIIQADDFDSAVQKAEEEANEYAAKRKAEYMGFANAYKSFDNQIANGIEVYSLIRKSPLDEDDYIDRFYDTGQECTRVFDQ